MAQRKVKPEVSGQKDGKKKSDSQSKTDKGKTTKKNSSAKSIPEPKNENNQFWSIILFALGILTGLMAIVEGSSGWRAIHNFLLGMFGVAVVAVPIILIYTALLIGMEKSQRCVTYRAFWGIALTILSGSVIQLYFVGDFKGDGIAEIVSELYNSGKHFRGGGLSSIIFAGPLLLLFGITGARIITAVIVCVFIMMLTNIGLFQLFEYILMPFKFIWNFILGLSKVIKGAEWEDAFYDDDDEEEDIIPIKTSKNSKTNTDDDEFSLFDVAPTPKAKKKDKKKITVQNQESDDFLFDIPIDDNPSSEPKVSGNKISESDSVSDEVYEEKLPDRNLEELINRAAELKPADMNPEIDYDEDLFNDVENAVQYTYIKPSLDLLSISNSNANTEEATAEMHEKADIIVNTLKSFGVSVRISDIYRGPSITRYEIQPGAGVKVSRIKGLEDDISLYLASQGVRIEAPVPGKACVGIEVPNITKDTVTLREILASKEFKSSESKLTFAVGKDIAGNIVLGDIAKMPHVIIAGTTGSGKSVCTRSIIMSILYNTTPEEVKIILIDPKIVEFKTFEGIPQLLIPVVTDPKKSAGALNWAVNEMIKRYQIFADNGANDLKSYNEIAEGDEILQKMPQIVIFIDELADLMLVAGKEVEDSICRLAQMGRASGIHLVIATQRPTTDVITGLIKANIPSRIALSVKSQIDSRTIIDMAGADKLLGNGDMLYYPIGATKPVRVQGCFSSSKDIEKTVEFVKSQMPEEYDNEIMQAVESFVPATKDSSDSSSSVGSGNSDEDIIEQAIIVAVDNGQLSTSMLQRKLKLGYARAARIMDELEEIGVIGSSEGAKPRKVLMSRLQFEERRARKLK